VKVRVRRVDIGVPDRGRGSGGRHWGDYWNGAIVGNVHVLYCTVPKGIAEKGDSIIVSQRGRHGGLSSPASRPAASDCDCSFVGSAHLKLGAARLVRPIADLEYSTSPS
jgi:hypothetical protein